MAPKLRVQYPGAMYHLMSRGDRREAIFADEAHRHRFLMTLGAAGVTLPWLLQGLAADFVARRPNPAGNLRKYDNLIN
jgi:hypothetical protein